MGNSTGVAAGPKKVVVRKAAANKVAAKKTAARRTTAKKAARRNPPKGAASSGPPARGSKETSRSSDRDQGQSRTSKAATPVREAKKSGSVARPRVKARTKPSLATAQARVVASKFAGPETAPKRKPRPSLPSTYGESRVLLLARDPHTLFAAWDMSREAVEGLKARLGSRSFAVSTLTLRMTPAGGRPSIFHLEKRARSRYLRIEGGASFVAEIGFTTPSGLFEFVARSAPCWVPLGFDRGDLEGETSGRSVVSYRDAITLLRRGEALSSPGRPGRANRGASGSARKATSPPLTSARVLGGASDLYRR